jgi:pentatricopeptide repeat protein
VHKLLFGLAREGDWPACLALLVDGGLRARFNIPPTVQAFASAMSGAASTSTTTAAGNLTGGNEGPPPDFLATMRAQGLAPDLVAYNVAVNLQRRLGRWERAVALLAEAEAAGVRPDVVTYTTAIAACGEAGRWERADELFEAMQSQGVEPTVVTYTALMAAFGRAGELGRCRALRRSMAAAGVAPSARFYQAAFAALAPAAGTRDDDGGSCCLLEMLDEMRRLAEDEATDGVMRPRVDAATHGAIEAACRAARRPELLRLVEVAKSA